MERERRRMWFEVRFGFVSALYEFERETTFDDDVFSDRHRPSRRLHARQGGWFARRLLNAGPAPSPLPTEFRSPELSELECIAADPPPDLLGTDDLGDHFWLAASPRAEAGTLLNPRIREYRELLDSYQAEIGWSRSG